MQPITVKVRNIFWYRLFGGSAYTKFSFDVANAWNELNPKQIRTYIRAIYLRLPLLFAVDAEQKLTIRNPQQLFISRIAILKAMLKFSFFKFYRVYPEEILRLLADEKAGDFLLTQYNLTSNPFKHYQHRPWHTTLYGPEDNLGDLTIEEFSYAEHFYAAYKKGNTAALNDFICMLYRPKQDGIKKPFIGITAHQYQNQIKAWPLDVKLAILINYESVFQHWVKVFPAVFSPDKTNTATKSKSGWLSIFRNMAGNKFGNYKETISTNAFVFFDEMQDLLTKPKDS